jgi:hypothetical protein
MSSGVRLVFGGLDGGDRKEEGLYIQRDSKQDAI